MKSTQLLGYLFPIFLLLSFACTDNDDDDAENPDDDNNDTEDPADDDQSSDNDTADDDTQADDDALDDDTTGDGVSPIVKDAWFDPELPGLGEWYGQSYWYQDLYMKVCDPNNDLLPDGQIELFDVPPGIDPLYIFMWYEATMVTGDLGDVDDCHQPATLFFRVWLSPENFPMPSGEYCYYIIAHDSAGNFDYVGGIDHESPVCFIVEEEK